MLGVRLQSAWHAGGASGWGRSTGGPGMLLLWGPGAGIHISLGPRSMRRPPTWTQCRASDQESEPHLGLSGVGLVMPAPNSPPFKREHRDSGPG